MKAVVKELNLEEQQSWVELLPSAVYLGLLSIPRYLSVIFWDAKIFTKTHQRFLRACFPCNVQFVWKWCTRNNWKIWLHVYRAVVLVIVIISFFEYWLRLFFSMYPDIIHLPRISWTFSWDFMSRQELSFWLIWLECCQYGCRQVISLISGQRAFWERVLWSIRFFVTFPYIFVSLAMLSRLG